MIRLGKLRTVGRELRLWLLQVVVPLAFLWNLSRWWSPTATSAGAHSVALVIGWSVLRQYTNSDKKNQGEGGKVQEVAGGVVHLPTKPISAVQRNYNPMNTAIASNGCDYLTTAQVPCAVLSTICSYLHPRDVTKLVCLNQAATKQFSSPSIWKELWYRDYGNVLLQWHIGRAVLQKSLDTSKRQLMTSLQSGNASLEYRLSQHLEHINNSPLSHSSLRDFYFVFGEIYLDYLLAGRNKVDDSNCYLGLHGHILDFTPFASYHPGGIERVLRECGGDATEYFERLSHSRGARSIARRLVVVVHQGCMVVENSDTSSDGCGLLLQVPPAKLHQMLRASNSRPLSEEDSRPTTSKPIVKRQNLWPIRHHSPSRRPPTLHRIRLKWDNTKEQEQKKTTSGFDWAMGNHWRRAYYDPICQEWKQWDAAV